MRNQIRSELRDTTKSLHLISEAGIRRIIDLERSSAFLRPVPRVDAHIRVCLDRDVSVRSCLWIGGHGVSRF